MFLFFCGLMVRKVEDCSDLSELPIVNWESLRGSYRAPSRGFGVDVSQVCLVDMIMGPNMPVSIKLWSFRWVSL